MAASGSRSGIIGQRQKSSTGSPRWFSVRDPQRHQTRCPIARPVLLEGDDLGSRAQGVADEDRAQQHEAAVEEVAAHALGRTGGLPDRHVADQVGVRERLAAAGDLDAQLRVEREAQPVAEERLVQGGVTRR